MSTLPSDRPTMKKSLSALGIVFSALACAFPAHAQAQSSDEPAVTPYRPSVSTPAALSATGWLEAEVGGLQSRGPDSARQVSVPYALKLAFSPDWGIRIAGNAFIRDTDPDGNRSSGFGDTAVILKRRFSVDDASAFGIEVGANLPTATSGLGSSKTDYSVNGIYSADVAAYHTDLNLILTRIGAIDPGLGRIQTTWAASLSRQLDSRWGIVGEMSGTRQSGAHSTAQFLVAGSYNASKSLTLDCGISRGLTSASPNWSIFAGITVLVSRLF